MFAGSAPFTFNQKRKIQPLVDSAALLGVLLCVEEKQKVLDLEFVAGCWKTLLILKFLSLGKKLEIILTFFNYSAKGTGFGAKIKLLLVACKATISLSELKVASSVEGQDGDG